MKIKQLGIVSAGVALATLGTSAAQAALVVVPPDLAVGDQYRLVFVTEGKRDATSTDIDDYNNFVTSQVLPAGTTDTALYQALKIAGIDPNTITWKAIGSTASVDARDNTGTNPTLSTGVPIYLIDGNRVANNNADLWDGSIQTAINRTPDDWQLNEPVWTGTNNNGTAENGRLGGGSLGQVRYGRASSITAEWITMDDSNRFGISRLYGISSVLTVPTPAVTVPEPSSLLGFITLGGLMLGGAVRKARK
ncbi:hypothetical protein MYAER_0826 [Microcystis aeruginosa NIES-2549]|uniref:PEP-CTERM protein-sorting domain-containing protein n=1 Tax=Microcystis aeruginosa NIES-2549 TaxID=1641812 RepID=A0A0F6U2N3_MICAE|nr:PEP-CTERM sorting domain-containing protein [Microcystis aeruginosa]AKE63186.1 hypothetical protein MYAER_0826 [Microcystis aeruginosa NIES-2549]AOC51578.1 hypothetical protein amyaer_0835 [Microcystis aeruginosa NIES-2481]